MRVVIWIRVVLRTEVTMRVLMRVSFVHEHPPQQGL
jgi:hypothetical protein